MPGHDVLVTDYCNDVVGFVAAPRSRIYHVVYAFASGPDVACGRYLQEYYEFPGDSEDVVAACRRICRRCLSKLCGHPESRYCLYTSLPIQEPSFSRIYRYREGDIYNETIGPQPDHRSSESHRFGWFDSEGNPNATSTGLRSERMPMRMMREQSSRRQISVPANEVATVARLRLQDALQWKLRLLKRKLMLLRGYGHTPRRTEIIS